MHARGSITRQMSAGFIALTLVVAAGACDSGSKGEAKQTSSIAEQVNAGSTDNDKKKKGTQAIDHGGITSVPDDPKLVKKGEKLFAEKGCKGCHRMDKKLTGPALGGVTERREPKWIARMIMHPDKMLEVDSTARKLLAEHATKMPNQNVSPEQARALIAYLGSQSGGK
ncbi:MAG: c-type cytochrome [Bradymonadaceae bacterium]